MSPKKYALALAGTMALLSGVKALAANPPADYNSIVRSDTELSKTINQEILSDPRLSVKDWENLKVDVKNGTVALSGTVTTDAAAAEVKRIAERHTSKVESGVASEETQQRERSNGLY